MTQHKFEFHFKRIILKPLEKDDIENLRVLRNKVSRFFLDNSIITAENQEKWYRHYLQKDNDFMFKVVKRDNPNIFVGAVAIYDIADDYSTAEVGRIMVDKNKAPEKGIGTEVTKAACFFAFDVLKIKELKSEVLKSNMRALEV